VAERTLAQLEAERSATAEEIRSEVFAAVAVAAARRDQAAAYRDTILPQAAEVDEMALDSYRSGQTGLAALLQALQTSRDLRLQAVEAGVEYQEALAEVEGAMGVALP
jgi:hypothetical protein